MAITATFDADFTPFNAGVQGASANLTKLEGGTVKAATAISGMNRSVATTLQPVNSLRESFGQFDQALAASGVNIGKYARGLAEITEMAGKTVLEIGALATAASIFAAAMAGWKFGEWIAGITGLDEAVKGYADSLTNITPVTAAAKLDVIILAILNGAKATITYTEAIKFNIKHLKDQADAYAVSAERLAAANKEVNELTGLRIKEIEIAEKNRATVEQITKAYGISADGLRVLAERKKLAAVAADEHAAAMKKEEAAAKAYDVEIANQIVLFDNLNKAAKATMDLKTSGNAAAGWIAQQVAIKKGIDDEAAATRAYLAEQEALTAATDALGQAQVTAGTAAVSATTSAMAGYAGVAQQVQITGDAIKEWIALMQYSAQVNAILSTNSLFTTQSQYQQIAALSPRSAGRGGAGSGGDSRPQVINVVVDGKVLTSIVNDRTARSLMQAGAV